MKYDRYIATEDRPKPVNIRIQYFILRTMFVLSDMNEVINWDTNEMNIGHSK